MQKTALFVIHNIITGEGICQTFQALGYLRHFQTFTPSSGDWWRQCGTQPCLYLLTLWQGRELINGQGTRPTVQALGYIYRQWLTLRGIGRGSVEHSPACILWHYRRAETCSAPCSQCRTVAMTPLALLLLPAVTTERTQYLIKQCKTSTSHVKIFTWNISNRRKK